VVAPERRSSRVSRRRTASANGQTVEIAVSRALAELDFAPGELSEEQYEVRVISQPEEGFLSVGGSDAVVEVTLVTDASGLDTSGLDTSGPDTSASGGTVAPGSRVEYSATEADDEDGPFGNRADDDYADDEDDDNRGNRADVDDVDDEDAFELLEDGDEPDFPAAGSARLREFLGVVIDALGIDARVRIVEEVDVVRADIAGDDVGVFIGRRGQTIDAVEYLASLILYPRPGTRKRVEIDAEGYKDRRRQSIERMAFGKAQEATRRGRPVEMEPMTPAERKIVHLALKERTDVSTESQGREPSRSVVISPIRSR